MTTIMKTSMRLLMSSTLTFHQLIQSMPIKISLLEKRQVHRDLPDHQDQSDQTVDPNFHAHIDLRVNHQ